MSDRSEKIFAGVGKSVLFLMLASVFNVLTAWFVMLAAGVAHGYWPQIPAFGYFATYLLILGVTALVGAVGSRWKGVS